MLHKVLSSTIERLHHEDVQDNMTRGRSCQKLYSWVKLLVLVFSKTPMRFDFGQQQDPSDSAASGPNNFT